MKQPLLFTLLSSAACVATAADKAPKQTTPEKQKHPTLCLSMPTISVMEIWNVTELKTYKLPMSTD